MQHEGSILEGKYRLVRPIGAGGMGTVWLAEKIATFERFAIKFIHQNALVDDSYCARFGREVAVLRGLRHPNIVDVFDWSIPEPGQPAQAWVVMELLEGEALQDVLRREGRLPVGSAIRVMLQVLDGVAAVHAMGIVHRDLSPANVFLVPSGGALPRVKILDFGLAKGVGVQQADSSVTQPGSVLGRAAYASPEMFLDAELDVRADIFACGMILYRTLAGRFPYRETKVDLMWAERYAERFRLDPYPPPSRHQPDIPTFVERIIMRSIRKRPADRFPSAVDMQRELLRADSMLTPGQRSVSLTIGTERVAAVDRSSEMPAAPERAGSTPSRSRSQPAEASRPSASRSMPPAVEQPSSAAAAERAPSQERPTVRPPPAPPAEIAAEQPASEAALPAFTIEPLAPSGVEGPASSRVERPAPITLKAPPPGAVEGPAPSKAEGPAPSRVEGPVPITPRGPAPITIRAPATLRGLPPVGAGGLAPSAVEGPAPRLVEGPVPDAPAFAAADATPGASNLVDAVEAPPRGLRAALRPGLVLLAAAALILVVAGTLFALRSRRTGGSPGAAGATATPAATDAATLAAPEPVAVATGGDAGTAPPGGEASAEPVKPVDAGVAAVADAAPVLIAAKPEDAGPAPLPETAAAAADAAGPPVAAAADAAAPPIVAPLDAGRETRIVRPPAAPRDAAVRDAPAAGGGEPTPPPVPPGPGGDFITTYGSGGRQDASTGPAGPPGDFLTQYESEQKQR